MAAAGSILIADDDATMLHSLAAVLECEGHRCECAANAYQAAQLLKVRSYDLLLSDIHMPGNANLRLVSEARRLAEDMPVILITGSKPSDFTIEPPVIACLSKCGNVDELLELVRISVARSRSSRGSQIAAW